MFWSFMRDFDPGPEMKLFIASTLMTSPKVTTSKQALRMTNDLIDKIKEEEQEKREERRYAEDYGPEYLPLYDPEDEEIQDKASRSRLLTQVKNDNDIKSEDPFSIKFNDMMLEIAMSADPSSIPEFQKSNTLNDWWKDASPEERADAWNKTVLALGYEVSE